jgi:chorismate mutase
MMLDLYPLELSKEADRPIIIAGPCSAESEEQLMETAKRLYAQGVRLFRAGIWKPRTKPGCFEGYGEQALPWLENVGKQLKMTTATEVATPEHVELALLYNIDVLWIGARTTANPFAVQSLADALKGVDVPVLVKNPVNPDLELWIGALERLNRADIRRLGVIHRGFSSYENKLYRNAPMWQIPIELRRRIPELPILCDPSHMGGKRDLIAPLSQQALDLGYDGLFVESHNEPDKALSDAGQQVTPDVLGYILSLLTVRSTKSVNVGLSELRHRIDEIDGQLIELLSKRMGVSREVAEYKREYNIPVYQTKRYSELMEKREAQGALCGLANTFVTSLFSLIHEESVNEQTKIINQKR